MSPNYCKWIYMSKALSGPFLIHDLLPGL